MRHVKPFYWLIVGLFLMATLAGCGGAATPVSCGVGTEGDPNTERFAANFTSIALAVKGGNAAITEAPANQPLVLRLEGKGGLTVRICVLTQGGTVQRAFDQSVITVDGSNDYDIGTFGPGEYRLHLLDRNVLIGLINFSVK
ncbi:MAG: hypothetical protein GXY52_11025 [Chloroflexi bacterium]|nr:hypothetical protein [Chloroflexota bacterium]